MSIEPSSTSPALVLQKKVVHHDIFDFFQEIWKSHTIEILRFFNATIFRFWSMGLISSKTFNNILKSGLFFTLLTMNENYGFNYISLILQFIPQNRDTFYNENLIEWMGNKHLFNSFETFQIFGFQILTFVIVSIFS